MAQPNDPAYKETEKIIKEIEKRLKEEYKQACDEVQEKLDNYLSAFEKKDRVWQKWVDEGKKTQQEYYDWRTGQIAIGKRWEEMKDTLAEDYHNANEIARSITDGYMPDVYALNHNYGTYEAESGAGVDTSYTLYDRQTVERLMRDDPELLPPPGKKTSERIAAGLDIRWNRQQIQSVMMQALLQGESITKIARRLADKVGDSNFKAAMRNARTMATGAQNAGRIDSYKRAEDMGIDLVEEWMATLDDRTRISHRELDGETRAVGETFSNGLLYPGDPSGSPEEVYNCRCCLVGNVKGWKSMSAKGRSLEKTKAGTYEEWKHSHYVKNNPILLPKEKAEHIRGAWIRKYREEDD